MHLRIKPYFQRPTALQRRIILGQFVVRYAGAEGLGITPFYPLDSLRESPTSVLQQTRLDRDAVNLGTGAHVFCLGKGRKERRTPLNRQARAALQKWLKEPARGSTAALFPNARGGRLSTDTVQFLLAKYVKSAGDRCLSLRHKRVSPHVLRHTAAMELLQAGVDISVIALWLGHESIQTTQVYLHAHIALKVATLAKLKPLEPHKTSRFEPEDQLLAFLDAL